MTNKKPAATTSQLLSGHIHQLDGVRSLAEDPQETAMDIALSFLGCRPGINSVVI
jgi:hypothetical protein